MKKQLQSLSKTKKDKKAELLQGIPSIGLIGTMKMLTGLGNIAESYFL